jgi:hypothetical protein
MDTGWPMSSSRLWIAEMMLLRTSYEDVSMYNVILLGHYHEILNVIANIVLAIYCGSIVFLPTWRCISGILGLRVGLVLPLGLVFMQMLIDCLG